MGGTMERGSWTGVPGARDLPDVSFALVHAHRPLYLCPKKSTIGPIIWQIGSVHYVLLAIHSPGFMKGFHLFLHHETGNIRHTKMWGAQKKHKACDSPPCSSVEQTAGQFNRLSGVPSHLPGLWFLWGWPVPHGVVTSHVQRQEERGPGVQSPLPPGKGRGNVEVRPPNVEGWWSHSVLTRGWGSGSEEAWLGTARVNRGFGALRGQVFRRGHLNPIGRSSGLTGSLGQAMKVEGDDIGPTSVGNSRDTHSQVADLGESFCGTPWCWWCAGCSLCPEAFLWCFSVSLVSDSHPWQQAHAVGFTLKPFQGAHRWETSEQADGTMWGLCRRPWGSWCPCRTCRGKEHVLLPFLLGYTFLVAMAFGLWGFHLCT